MSGHLTIVFPENMHFYDLFKSNLDESLHFVWVPALASSVLGDISEIDSDYLVFEHVAISDGNSPVSKEKMEEHMARYIGKTGYTSLAYGVVCHLNQTVIDEAVDKYFSKMEYIFEE